MIDLDQCVLNQQIREEVTTRGGYARIEMHWNDDIVRDCPICGGTKLIQVQDARHEGYRFYTSCPGMRRMERVELFNRAHVPGRYGESTFENFSLDVCRDQPVMLRNFMMEIERFEVGNQGYLLEGDCGCGKTHLMCAAIRYLTTQLGIVCRYVDFSRLMSEIRASYSSDNGMAEADIIRPLTEVPVLFLDELGRGNSRDNTFEIRVIESIVAPRYNDPTLSTFFGSNYKDHGTSGYQVYRDNGYNPFATNPIASERWRTFAAKRWKEENARKRPDETKFKNIDDFHEHVRAIMSLDHIEDRVTERVASRILAMSKPLYIDAPNYRNSVKL